MRPRFFCLLLASTVAGTNTPVFAEEAAEGEIIVSGIRQAYSGDFEAKEIPKAIAVIEAEQLEDNNILRLTDALDLNASIARQNNFGGLWDAFAVRGFSGDENLPSGYLVNGFNNGRGFGGARDVAGVERIEVLKGPTAALFGRGEPGGTINIITKQADFDDNFVSVSGLYGSFDRFRGDADVNLAFADRIAFRLIGFYEEADSFRQTLSSKRFGFLPSISLRLGEATTLRYDLELTRSEADFDRGVLAINGNLNVIPRNRFLGEPTDGPLEAEVTGHQLQLQHEFNDSWSALLGASYRDTSLEGFSNEAELAQGRQRLFVDGRSLSRQRRFRDYDSEHLVFRGEIAGEFNVAGLRNRILIGGDFDKFENSQLFLRFRPPSNAAAQTLVSGNIIDIFNPIFGQFPAPAVGPQTNTRDTQEAFGFYIQDQISLTDSIQIRVGGRYDEFSLETLNRAIGIQRSLTASRFSPQAGIVFETAPWLSLYAAYGDGFRSNIGSDALGRIFDPERSNSIEVGAKFSVLDNALSGTLSLFRLRRSNVLVADTSNPGFSIPLGRAGSHGIELDIAGRLPGNIDLLLSYAFVDAEARSDVLEANFSLPIRAGDPLINIPRHSLNAQISKGIDIGERQLRVGAGVQHVGERLGQAATTFTLPAYTLVRLFANLRLTEGVELFGDIKNLFDEEHFTNSFAALWVRPGDPRTATVGVRVKF